MIIRPGAPFRLDLTVWALRRRPRNALDLWDGTRYSRTIAIGGTPARIVVSQTGPADDPKLEVLCVSRRRAVEAATISDLVARLLGVNVSLVEFYQLAATDARITVLLKRFMGFRPPRFPTVFEAAVNAVCCQQLSLEVGLELMNRLVAAAGMKYTDGASTSFAFPEPGDIARLSEDRLHRLGFSGQKAVSLLSLAWTLAKNEGHLENLAEMDNESARTRLLEIKGIGRWSAEYILLRGLGRLDVFPADDIAAQRNLRRWLKIGARTRHDPYELIQRALRRWRPYQGIVYFHLLLASFAERGLLERSASDCVTLSKSGVQRRSAS
jgi:DNA-3-methyladenine glycosylase II